MPAFLDALRLPLRERERTAKTGQHEPAHKGHICFVALDAWPVLSGADNIERVGGAEVQQRTLARALAREGYKTSMITLDHGQPDAEVYDGAITCYKTYAPDAGIKVLRFVHPRLTSVWRALERADANVYYVRAASMLLGVVTEFCRRNNRRSVFAAASELDFLPGQQSIEYARDRWLFERGLARADAVVVQTQSQHRHCRQNYGREATWIPSCYEPPADATNNPQGSVLWVSTIRRNKRPELFLELARRLPHRRFVMAGGPGRQDEESRQYYESIRSQAQELGNVEFLGYVPLSRIERHFDAARVFVNTSVYEGFPNTFLQSWARGIPTAAFVDTGSREGGGPLYPVVTTMDELDGAVERLMADDAAWQEASARSRRYFDSHHTVPLTMRRYRNVLANVLPAYAV